MSADHVSERGRGGLLVSPSFTVLHHSLHLLPLQDTQAFREVVRQLKTGVLESDEGVLLHWLGGLSASVSCLDRAATELVQAILVSFVCPYSFFLPCFPHAPASVCDFL